MTHQPKLPIKRLSVLVADSEPHMASLVAGMLRTLKVRTVREVNSTTTTMTELRRRPFDVLVIDDDLGPLSSIEFTRRLRTSEDCINRHVPIIMMSASPSVAAIKAARDAGINEFLRKPFAAQHLEMRLNAILNAPRPFIAAEAYVGPDRRRRTGTFAGEERRGSRDKATPSVAG